MDEFTRERYGPVIPYHEAYALPNPLPGARGHVDPNDEEWIRQRRIGLCGTDDLSVEIQGGESPEVTANRRLIKAIRAWKDGRAA